MTVGRRLTREQAMKTIWKGAISFGLVTIPVKVYTATEEKTLKFNQLHAPDGGRIRYKRVCSIDGEEALAKVAFRDKEHLATVRLRENVLVLETMFWPDEIRAARFDELDEEVELRPQEIKMARSLIDSLSDDFEPEDFQDEYRSALEDLISKKVQGEEV